MNSKHIVMVSLLLGLAFGSAAQQTTTLNNGIEINGAQIERTHEGLRLSFDADLTNAKVSSDNTLEIVPSLASATDTLRLARFSIVGRNRYYYNLRNNIVAEKISAQDVSWLRKETPGTYHFDITLPFGGWMNGSRIMINEHLVGCCNRTIEDNWYSATEAFILPGIPAFSPSFVYRKPKAEVEKVRALRATSYVDFPVSRTEIYPNYRNNPRELAKIVSTIESVLQDTDIRVRSISLHGYASPESPYSNNVRLAKGRTASIKKYVSEEKKIPSELILTDYTPENWEGLREWILTHEVSNAEGIIAIIDRTDLEQDPKEALLKKTYPAEYKYLLENCYPGLRKVDYVIEYDVRNFVSIEEIRAAYEADPSKLSRDEFYMLASSLDEGDPMHDQILKDAVRYLPEDAATNLNAANVAMKEGRLRDAGAHLEKAGDTFEAIYARSVYFSLIGNYERAEAGFNTVKAEIPEAENALQQVQTIVELTNLWKL